MSITLNSTIVLSRSAILSMKHNPSEDILIKNILNINHVNPKLRLVRRKTGVTWRIMLNNKDCVETHLIGSHYTKKKSVNQLNHLKKMLASALKKAKRLGAVYSSSDIFNLHEKMCRRLETAAVDELMGVVDNNHDK